MSTAGSDAQPTDNTLIFQLPEVAFAVGVNRAVYLKKLCSVSMLYTQFSYLRELYISDVSVNVTHGQKKLPLVCLTSSMIYMRIYYWYCIKQQLSIF